MRVVDIIDKKKKNKELTKAEIEFLLGGYLKGTDTWLSNEFVFNVCIF